MLDDLSRAMNALWRTHDVSSSEKEGGDELVLSTFGGFCFGCKKKGHKAHECPEKQGSQTAYANGNGGAMKCNHCGKPGHKHADCWQ